MLIIVKSVANYGIKSVGVDVEVNVATKGFPTFDIVGLPNKAISESRERIKTALLNSDFEFPNNRITVNLAPADLPKDGSFYDLPISVGVLSSIVNLEIEKRALFYGELSLDGSLRHTKGGLLAAIYAKENGFKSLYLPYDSANEAVVVEGVDVYGVKSLQELYSHLANISPIKTFIKSNKFKVVKDVLPGFGSVLGQEQAKRVLEVAAAGGHNVLLTGSPGAGKTMLARAFPTILPELTFEESLEVTKLYSAAGEIPPNGSLITERPHRFPHHTTSYAGLIGGGNVPRPGEISLAHRGVLFLDEFPEFPRHVLESLRQPLEDGEITIARSGGSVTFPTRFILLAASNPCPCGYLNHPKKNCICTQNQIYRYNKKISGPLLDRIDLCVEVLPVSVQELGEFAVAKANDVLKENVQKARDVQVERFKDLTIFNNAEMANSHIQKFCSLNKDVIDVLNQAVIRFNLSARVYFKTIKVARTIADLESSRDIQLHHITEALQYRKT